MEEGNKTMVKEFILLAFSNLHKFQILLFIIILLMYMICITGNIAIIVLVMAEPALQIPMYFFISIFASLEIIFVSVTIPNLLVNLIAANKKISFVSCFAQMYVFGSLGVTECYLLVVMVFDRHLAINNPLHYTGIMSRTCCKELATLPWIFGFVVVLIPTILTAGLDFCGPNEINHFFCDLVPLQDLACSNSFIINAYTSTAAAIEIAVPFIIIIGFYIHIIVTVSKIKSSEGKHKAFATCSSHLIISSLFYVTAIIVYARPKGSEYDKFLSLMYTVVTPMVNPFIYTFRNRDVKMFFKKYITRTLKRLKL